MSDKKSDFSLPKPLEGGTQDIVDNSGLKIIDEPASFDGLLSAGLTNMDLIIAGGVLLMLLGLMLLPRRALIISMHSQFADYGRAKSAGNSLYAFLVVLGISTTIGFLGNMWTTIEFIVSAAIINIILFVVFIISFSSARTSRVKR